MEDGDEPRSVDQARESESVSRSAGPLCPFPAVDEHLDGGEDVSLVSQKGAKGIPPLLTCRTPIALWRNSRASLAQASALREALAPIKPGERPWNCLADGSLSPTDTVGSKYADLYVKLWFKLLYTLYLEQR